MGVVPDLTTVGYTRENPPTPHVAETRQRLEHLTSRIGSLETHGGSGLASRVTTLETDLASLLLTVNNQSLLIDHLLARLNYGDAYLQMIDEAIHVEGFPGWEPRVQPS